MIPDCEQCYVCPEHIPVALKGRPDDIMGEVWDAGHAFARRELRSMLSGVEHVLLTSGHPEFGIECTMAIGEHDVTVTNQPDPLTALATARAELHSIIDKATREKAPDPGVDAG